MKKTYKIALLASMVMSTTAMAMDFDFYKDLNSDQMTQRLIGNDEDFFEYVVYQRKGSEGGVASSDYFYMWHGDRQEPGDFMNATGLMEAGEEAHRRSAVFLAPVQMGDWLGERGFGSKMRYMGQLYESIQPARRKISVGYDLGVAGAYQFGCEHKLDTIILSQGGLYDDENCAPQNTQLLYSLNVEATQYPVYAVDGEELTGRLDGNGTHSALVNLMRCGRTPMTSTSRTGSMLTYTCAGNNQLTVLLHDVPHHQWNGYVNTPAGFSNMQGEPVAESLNNWISSELHVK